MARAEVIRCDRCGSEEQPGKVHRVSLDDKGMDLCNPCFSVLKSWIGKMNGRHPGDIERPKNMRGPGWREVCPHHVPCGGNCPTPLWQRVV